MADLSRTAEAVWSGGRMDGVGTVERLSRPGPEAISWRDRIATGPVGTTPEELIAAAHAGCLSMATAKVLGENGTPAQRLVVKASCVFELDEQRRDGRIARIDAVVSARVPGLDAEAFHALVRAADAACHVSNALCGGVVVSVTGTLEQPAAG
jgi:osmotically inducible protein OsmC